MRQVRVAIVPLLVLGLLGCQSEEERLAADVCDVLERFVEDPESLMDEDIQEELQEVEARIEEADVSDQAMQDAVEDECPDVFAEIEGPGDPLPDDDL